MKHVIMGTAGHVDHGKTSLIKALTHIDCDTHKEEKARGITINLGFAHIDLPSGNSIGIIDVPGHKDFINTMVGGACGIDFVLMVIAADSGVMPQTKEHFNIIRALKVKKAIIALNKIDLVDEDIAELAKLEIMEWLEDTEFKDSPIIGVSSLTGKGLDELKMAMDDLIPQLEEKKEDTFFRMFIDRIFTVKGLGSVVTGSVLNGEIALDQDLFLLPGNHQKLRIRGMERHGNPVEKVIAGDRAAFNLSGLKPEDFVRGMLLSDKEMEATSRIDAHITLFENSVDVKLWSTIVFHSGTFESQARMHLLNKDSIKPGDEAIVQIILEKDSILLNKDQFIIRNSSGDKSIGGGIIIDAQALNHRKRTPKLLEGLELLAIGILNEGKTAELIKLELKKVNLPLYIEDLADKLHLSIDEIKAEFPLLSDIAIYNTTDSNILISAQSEKHFSDQICSLLEDHHQKNSLLMMGLEEIELAGKFGFSKNKTAKLYLSLLLIKMKRLGKLVSFRNTWALSSHRVKLDQQTEEEINWLEKTIKNYGNQKPIIVDIIEASKRRKISSEKYKLYINYLTQNDLLTHFKNEYIHSHVLAECKDKLLGFLNSQDSGVYLQQIKEATPFSKKMMGFLIEICEAEKLVVCSDHNKDNFKTTITPKGIAFIKKTNHENN